jgi:hypothetical protein
VRVSYPGGDYDVSDGDFNIGSAAGVVVTYPNGNDKLVVGGDFTITWNAVGVSGNVDIDYSVNGDAGPWNTVVGGTANDGSHTWTVPAGAVGSNCRIRVQQTSGGSPSGMSASDFEVVNPGAGWVAIVSPAAGDVYHVGDTVNISWVSDIASGTNVELYFSCDSGATWHSIDNKIDVVTGNPFAWTILSTARGTHIRIRIEEDTNSPDWFDESNADFTVLAASGSTVNLTYPDGGDNQSTSSTCTITWSYTGGAMTTRHPILTAGSNAYCTSATMEPPWNQGAGDHDLMWCSDCHRTDASSAPHGHASGQKVWGGLAASNVDPGTGGSGVWHTPLCVKCHNYTKYTTNGTPDTLFNHVASSNHHVEDDSEGYNRPGGCLACHYGAEISGVHGSNSSDYFMAGSFITSNSYDNCNSEICNGHSGRSY